MCEINLYVRSVKNEELNFFISSYIFSNPSALQIHSYLPFDSVYTTPIIDSCLVFLLNRTRFLIINVYLS